MLKFTAVRMVAFPLGIAYYIYAGLNWPSVLRSAQWLSGWIANTIEDSLPDAYAVWMPALNIDSGIVMMMFTIAAFICVEIVIIIFRSIFHRH